MFVTTFARLTPSAVQLLVVDVPQIVPVRVLQTLHEEGAVGVADKECPNAALILKHYVDSEPVRRRLEDLIRISSEFGRGSRRVT